MRELGCRSHEEGEGDEEDVDDEERLFVVEAFGMNKLQSRHESERKGRHDTDVKPSLVLVLSCRVAALAED